MFPVSVSHLSGPVLRDTARLSQQYPPIARYGVFGVSTWLIGCDPPPPPLFWAFPPWRACEVEVRYPPHKRVSQRYLRDTTWKQGKKRVIAPLCDTISKGYCAIWGGIFQWAAKLPIDDPTKSSWSESITDMVRRQGRAIPGMTLPDSIALCLAPTPYVPLFDAYFGSGVKLPDVGSPLLHGGTFTWPCSLLNLFGHVQAREAEALRLP